jgi:hypothetical protein
MVSRVQLSDKLKIPLAFAVDDYFIQFLQEVACCWGLPVSDEFTEIVYDIFAEERDHLPFLFIKFNVTIRQFTHFAEPDPNRLDFIKLPLHYRRSRPLPQ